MQTGLVWYQPVTQQVTSWAFAASPKLLDCKVEVKRSHKAWLARQGGKKRALPSACQAARSAPTKPSFSQSSLGLLNTEPSYILSWHNAFLSYCPVQLPHLLPTLPLLLCPYSNYPFFPPITIWIWILAEGLSVCFLSHGGKKWSRQVGLRLTSMIWCPTDVPTLHVCSMASRDHKSCR